MAVGLTTSAGEVERIFAAAGAARPQLARWKRRKNLEYVAEKVMSHVSSAVYSVRSEQVKALATEHPIGRVRPAQGYRVQDIKNWHPDFAFVHLFHFCLEEKGGIFSYEDFRDWCRPGHPAHEWISAPALTMVEAAVARQVPRKDAMSAMKWRVGLAYYSFLREMYAVAALRELGLDMRSHCLADALFRVDTWCGDTVVELYIKNREFKSGGQGRKKTAADYLAPGQAQFRFVRLEMEPRHEYGRVHLPTDEEIERCAGEIRRACAS